MPSWPASLPQRVLPQSYRENAPDVVLRTEMDAGPAKTRRRFTAGVRPFQVALVMTEAQVETFDSFLEDEIGSGALSFDWVHPRTQVAATVRIVTPPPPSYAPVGSGGDWLVSFGLEILP